MSLKIKLTREEALSRSKVIKAPVDQAVHLDIRRSKDTYDGRTTINFSSMQSSEQLWLEFAGSAVHEVAIDGEPFACKWDGARIFLPEISTGEHTIEIAFTSMYTNRSVGIHHFHDPDLNTDYYYSNLCPYEAGRIFPCLDQPDLKACFSLTVEIPERWVAVANSLQISERISGSRKLVSFATTAPIATYVFALCFGDYKKIVGPSGSIPMNIYCRSEIYRDVNADPIFGLISEAIEFYEEFFQTPFAFQKYDQIFVPEFNWGAMENVGCVVLREEMLFKTIPTKAQLFGRDNTLVHELAHMWFGNLVSMDWWDDLWLNEAFATLMAYVCLERIKAYPDSMLFFHDEVQLKAKEEDSFRSTHPIVVNCLDTDQAFQNFDAITYLKGASVLKQLLYYVGEEQFRKGIKSFFEQFKFSNANLEKFLMAFVGKNLTEWSEQWLSSIGFNEITPFRADGELRIEQSASKGLVSRNRSFLLRAANLRHGGTVVWEKRIDMSDIQTTVKVPEQQVDLWLLNGDDHDYMQMNLDAQSLESLRNGLHQLTCPKLRLQLSTSLHEMLETLQISFLDYYAMIEQLLIGQMQTFVGRILLDRVLPYIQYPELKNIKTDVLLAVKREFETSKGEYRIFLFDRLLSLATSEQERVELADYTDLNEDQNRKLLVHLSAMQNQIGQRALDKIRSLSGLKARQNYLTAQMAHSRGQQRRDLFETIYNDKSRSLGDASALMSGFFVSGLNLDLSFYAREYYIRLKVIEKEHDQNYLKRYFGCFFPRNYINCGLSEIDVLLASTQGAVVKRQLIQWQDYLAKMKKIYIYNKITIDTE